MLKLGNEGNTPYGILVITVLTFFIVTYFLAFHGDRVEGLAISAYVEEALSGEPIRAPKLVRAAFLDDVQDVYNNSKGSSGANLKYLLFEDYQKDSKHL